MSEFWQKVYRVLCFLNMDFLRGREMLFIKVSGPTSQGVDAYTGEPREVTYAFEQDPFDADALFNRIHGIEYHEACEWFRVNGELLFDPHATEGRDMTTERGTE